MAGNQNFADDVLWYKDGIIYQVHVKAYRDSNNDGIGDFGGLLEKLDYIEALGVNIIWLLPFYPSPLKDDGYDIADYYKVHPQYGNIDDLKSFIKEAHHRGIKVITELVLNHTSDQHQWFQAARKNGPGTPQGDYYVWSNTPDKYRDARIIFQDFEISNWTYDSVAKAYYWHRFYSHQPDLNFDNPQVHKSLFKVVDFWLEMGVDGLRLDAVPYLYEREGTNCENLPETHQFLKKLSEHVQSRHKNKMLLAEANQWPEDAVAYFGNGDECQMAFHFPLMPRLYMSIQMEDRFPIIDIMEQTPEIPPNCQWAMFLRNHDELTLEMVTDEERDYMYRFYARDARARINLGIRRRLAPLVDNNRRKIELLNILLFSFPGTPIIYYGDEIGMGDNFYLGDRNGVRTPMQWSSDRNAGFSSANPQKLYLPVIIDPEYHFEAVNVEVQQRSSSSMLWWMKRAIAIRKSHKAFGRGSLEFLSPANSKVLAFFRKYEDETILIVANLSRFSQVTELDLSKYNGYTLIEAFSRNEFPVIRDVPYVLTLNAYDYFWFILDKKSETLGQNRERKIPELTVKKSWRSLLEGEEKSIFEDTVLAEYIRNADWFQSRNSKIQDVRIFEEIPLPDSQGTQSIFLLRISFLDTIPEMYLVPVASSKGEPAKKVLNENPASVLAYVKTAGEDTILHDAFLSEDFRQNFLKMLVRKRNIRTLNGELTAAIEKRLKKYFSGGNLFTSSQLVSSSPRFIQLLYANTLIIKLYRKLDEGINPGVELLRLLTDKAVFENIPPYGGDIHFVAKGGLPYTLGLLKEYVSNQGSAWNFIVDAVKHHFDYVITNPEQEEIKNISSSGTLFTDSGQINMFPVEGEMVERIYNEMICLLGKRTGELHIALNSIEEVPNYAPEPFSMLYQRSIYQFNRSQFRSALRNLNRQRQNLSEGLSEDASEIINGEEKIMNFISRLLEKKLSAHKIRIHGDYHLDQVLFTGKDFVIANFEGAPSASIGERKLKRSPLRDVASMIWSFHFAAYTALQHYKSTGSENIHVLEQFTEGWWLWNSGNFLSSYISTVENAGFLPEEKGELEYMLILYMLERKLIELNYSLVNDIEKLTIPLKGLKHLLGYIGREKYLMP